MKIFLKRTNFKVSEDAVTNKFENIMRYQKLRNEFVKFVVGVLQ
jgi:hypothetical protein